MNVPENLKYTESHEWVRVEGDEIVIGITDHAQEMLGDIVFVGDCPVGNVCDTGTSCATVESVKAASDIYSPLAGVITAYNDALDDAPEQINSDPYDAWIFKLKPQNIKEIEQLLSAAAYEQHSAA